MTGAAKTSKRPARSRDDDRDPARTHLTGLRPARLSPPSPDTVLGRAGRPMDPSVRRELEDELGIDLSRVRIHNDEQAAALTELIGADAVAVGNEIFFAEGAYRPQTEPGRRLLLHELMHTVQVPTAPGPLRLDRTSGDGGTLSRRLDPLERAAEAGVERGRGTADTSGSAAGRSDGRPSWMRFVSIDVSQLRAEVLDPAMLVDRMVAGIIRSLRGDPADASGRVRQQLARLSPDLRVEVMTRLEKRLPTADLARVQRMLAEIDSAAGQPPGTGSIPVPVVETTDLLEAERDERELAAEGDEAHAESEAADQPTEESEQAEDAEDAQAREDQAERDADAEEERARRERDADADAERLSGQRTADQAEEDRQRAEDERSRADDEAAAEQDEEAAEAEAEAEAGSNEADAAGAEATAMGLGGMLGGAGPPAPAARASRTGGPPAGGAGGVGTDQPAVRPERVDALAERSDSPLVRHGLIETDAEAEPPEQEKPEGLEPDAEGEVEQPETETEQAESEEPPGFESGAPDPLALDPVPKTDLDLSGVPTVADELAAAPGGELPKPRESVTMPSPPSVEVEPEDLDRKVEEESERLERDDLADADAERAAAERAEDPELGEAEVGLEEPEVAPAEAEATPEEQDEVAEAEAEEAGAREPSAERAAEPEAREEAAEPVEEAEPAGTGESARDGGAQSAVRSVRSAARPVARPPARLSGGPRVEAAGAASAAAGGAGPAGRVADEPSASEPGPGDRELADPTRDRAGGPAGPPAAPGAGGVEGEQGPGAGPEGSLEPGGGECDGGPTAGPEAAEAGAGGGGGGGCGGGGGGGDAEAEADTEAAGPDLAGQEPKSALASAGGLPAAQIPGALGGVEASVDRVVTEEHGELEGNPPELERPVGAPETLSGPPQVGEPVQTGAQPLTEVTPESLAEQRQAKPPPTPTTGNPGDRIRSPNVAGGPDGSVSDAEVRAMQNAVNNVPTSDSRLFTTVGPAPKVKLEGETDPELADEQKRQADENVAVQVADARRDSDVGMGEDQIYPDVPPETLTAQVPGIAGGAGGAAGAAASHQVDSKTLSIVTEEEKGGEVKAAVSDGRSQMGDAETQKDTDSATSRTESQAEIEAAEAQSTADQAAERDDGNAKITAERENWRTEQDETVDDENEKADEEYKATGKGITDEKTKADEEAEEKRDEENGKIEREREAAEAEARRKKQEKKKESSSWWGRAKAAVKSAFDAIASVITGIFDAAIAAVNKIKEGFKKLVNGIIDLAAKAITALIKGLATLLLAMVDTLLAAFPELRDKFRAKIEEWRDKAIAKVQEYAEKLKELVNKLIDALAGLLVAYLEAYKKLLLFAVELVGKAIEAVLSAVEAAIKLLGEFAALVADIAPAPLRWLGNLGSAAADGTRNHLWGQLKEQVRAWFNGKVESLIGLGKALWDALIKGCLSIEKIGKMAWQAIIAALPMMIITLVIEKLVSMVVPAAGAILTIIQGLRAAWGAISQIIAAFAAFFDFLKSVKGGGAAAACKFAIMVAAAAVALLAFIAEFLLMRIGGALKKLGGTLKSLAQKVMKGLGRGAKAVKKTAGKAMNAAKSASKATANAARRGAKATAAAARRGGQAAARTAKSAARATAKAAGRAARTAGRAVKKVGSKVAKSKAGRAVVNSARRAARAARQAAKRARDAIRRRRDNRRKNAANRKKKREDKAARLRRIVARIRPRILGKLERGSRGIVFRATLTGMRVWYRLSALAVRGSRRFNITARLNPQEDVGNGFVVDRDKLLKFVRDEGRRLIEQGRAKSQEIGEGTRQGSYDPKTGRPREIPEYTVPKGVGLPSVLARAEEMKHRGWGSKEVLSYLGNERSTRRPPAATRRGRVGRGAALEVARQQKAGKTRNKIVTMLESGKEIRNDLKYTELADKFSLKGEAAGKNLGKDLSDFAAGGRPTGPNRDHVAFLGSLMVVQEGHRNPGAVVTAGMAIQTMEKNGDVGTALKELPMAMDKAQKASDDVEKYLARTPEEKRRYPPTQDAEKLMRREIDAIRRWVRALDFHAKGSPRQKEQQLFDLIRSRMQQLYFPGGGVR